MKRSSSLKRRVKEIETARGAGAVTLTFADGSKQGFNFSRNDRLKVLLASFEVARVARNPNAQPSSSSRAIAVAQAIGNATEIAPRSRLWDTVAGIVQQAEEDRRNCNNHAPGPACDSFSEAKE